MALNLLRAPGRPTSSSPGGIEPARETLLITLISKYHKGPHVWNDFSLICNLHK